MAHFTKHVNRKLSCKSDVGPVKKRDGTLCVNDQKKADILNDYFGSVWVDDDDANPIFLSRVPSDTFIDDISFTSVSVFKTLSNLKNEYVAGPDKIKPVFYQRLASLLSSPLASMFNTFLEADFLPLNDLLHKSDRFLRRGAHLTPTIIDLFH